MSALPRVGIGLALASTLLTGCTVSVNGNPEPRQKTPSPNALTSDGGVHTWDLRTPPNRADAGFGEGKNTSAFYGADERRRVRLRLPEGVALTGRAELLVLQAITSPEPAGLDASSGLLPRERAYQQFKTNLRQIGASTAAADRWLALTEGKKTDDPNEWSPIGAGENRDLGYVGVSVGARFSPASGKAKIVWTMGWRPHS